MDIEVYVSLPDAIPRNLILKQLRSQRYQILGGGVKYREMRKRILLAFRFALGIRAHSLHT
jgi:hypothetical protein